MLYAKQIPPEFQESPLSWRDWPDGIITSGNRHFIDHTTNEFDRCRELFNSGELADILDDISRGPGYSGFDWYDGDAARAINDLCYPADSRGPYTADDIAALQDIFTDAQIDDENNILSAVLSIVTGQTWEYCTIVGCYQGDWEGCFYNTVLWPNGVDCFEAEYFNTGSEWIVHDGPDDPDGPDDIIGCAYYCYTFDPAAEIAEYCGADPADVVLYSFDGFSRVPRYVCNTKGAAGC